LFVNNDLINLIPTNSFHTCITHKCGLRWVLNELCGPTVGWSWPAWYYTTMYIWKSVCI